MPTDADRIEDSFPLAPIQEGMLFDSLFTPGSGVDVILGVVDLTEALDEARFVDAWRRVTRRHPALRTCFRWQGLEQPCQDVHTDAFQPVRHEDWSALPPDEQELHWRELQATERATGFDMARPPLTRLVTVRLGPARSRVVWVYHHALFDGLGMVRVLAEVFDAYRALPSGGEGDWRPSPPPRAWVEWLRRRDTAASEAFWRGHLAGITGPTRLGIDRGEEAGAGRVESCPILDHVLSEADTTALHDWARARGMSLNVVLQGAWAILLSRYSGERRVVFGVVKSGRRSSIEDAERVVGVVMNTLPTAVDVDPASEVDGWFSRLAASWSELRRHENVPLVRIREWTGIEGRLPLFESFVCYDPMDTTAALREHGVEVGRAEIFSQPVVPVSINAYDGPRLLLRLHYHAPRVEAGAAARLHGHLETLLRALAAGTAARIGDLPLLTGPERREALALRGPEQALPPGTTIHGLFEAQCARTPQAVAVGCDGAQLTYAQLDARAERLAAHLRGRGVGPDRMVGLCVDRDPDLLVGMLGILKAGGAWVPLDPHFPTERLALVLQDTAAAVLVTQRRLRSELPPFEGEVVCLDDELPEPGAGGGHRPEHDPRRLAYVIHTSGSTGRPKGVAIEHRSVVNFLASMAREPGLGPGDVLLAVTTLSFDIAVLELLGPLCVGARVELASREVSADGRLLRRKLAETKATVMQATPATWQLLVHAEWEGDGRLKMLCGGEALPRPLAQELLRRGGELWNMYGPTETTIWSAVARVTRQEAAGSPGGADAGGQALGIGPPIANTSLCVLDSERRLVPVGIPGELFIGGDGLARGYLNQPALTAEKFVPSPWPTEWPGRLYATGDLVRRDEAGGLAFLGRSDHQVKLRGFRIELGEVEAALGEWPQVAETVVMAREDSPGDKRLVAYVIVRAGATLDLEGLRGALRRRLPEYMVPATVVALDRFPLSPNGKVNRRALPAPQAARAGARYVAPRTPTEAGLAETWSDLLGVERVGAHDDFFALGGHSLLATRLLSRIRNQFQAELLIRQVFDTPTLAGLAETVEAERRAGERVAPPPIRPLQDPAPPPVSFAQGRLWFLDRMGAGAAYNMQLILGLDGPLDRDLLARSLAAVVARQGVLRTRFEVVDGTPRQVVQPAVEVRLDFVDAAAEGPLSGADGERAVQQVAARAASEPFDLARGPLFRASLVRTAEEGHALVFTIHHIACDAWSLGVLRREIAAHYRALLAGREPDLPPLPVQYADFAAWQRDWLSGDVLERQLSYWKGKLGGGLPVLNLPTDRPRAAVQSFQGASRRFLVAEPLAGALRALAREQGVTLAMLLLAAWEVLLSRYSGQDDIVLGSPIANRRQANIEDLVGFFVNSLVLRADLSGNPAFTELLERVRALSLEAYDHQDLPFEKVVDALDPERDLARPPLFQATFAMQNVPDVQDEVPGLALRVIEPALTTTRFDLELYCVETREGLAGTLYFNTELFDPESAEGLVEHFRLLLAGLVEDPRRPLSELPLLLPDERERLLVEWNDSATGYPRDRSVHALFAAQAARTPDAVAVQSGERTLTYAELDRRANRVAHALRRRGAGPGVLVGICMERGPEFVVGLLGILKSGAAYVPMDSDYPAQRLALMLADARPAVLVTLQAMTAALPAFEGERLCLDEDGAGLAAESEAAPPPCGGPGDLAYVIYTSGSTGKPKGVCVPHRAIARLVLDTDYVQVGPDDGVAQASNAAFDAATFEIWGALLNGARLVSVPKAVLLSPPALAEQIRAEGISVLFVTTALFNQLSVGAPGIFAPLRCLLFGGEAVDPARVRAVLADGAPRRLLHVYGPTENTTFSTWHEVRDVPAKARTVPIGGPIANSTCHVLDAQGQPVPVGAPGELFLGGDGLATGYLHDPELTARRFVPDHLGSGPATAGAAGARLYRTGDVVRRRRDGAIEFVGRTDHQVKLRGFRIELGEIEAALVRQERVRDVAVLCREDTPGEKRLVAYVVPDEGGGRSEEQDVVGQWGALYEDLYGKTDEREVVRADPSFNLIGWNSSYDGQPIPAEEMREWVAETVGNILAARPRRVLEIGFGTGLLLFRVAPHCEEYVGLDFSAVALDWVGKHLPPELAPRVTLHQRLADDLAGIPTGHFDVVVLNSIIQYFPSSAYLLRVIEGAVERLAPGGRVIVGDVRNFRLLEPFQAAIDACRAPPDLPAAELARQVKQHLLQDEELLVDPGFFLALARHLPRVAHVEVEPKRGAARNELTQYRYQATIHVDRAPAEAGEVRWLDWPEDGLDEAGLRARLAAHPHAAVGVRRVPNDRTLRDAELAAALAVAPAGETVGELCRRLAGDPRCRGVDPAALGALAAGLSRRLLLSWASTSSSGEYDALFLPAGAAGEAAFPMPRAKPRAWDSYCNRPIQAQMMRQLAPRLREALSETLPDYMLPSAFVMLEALPLNANGKVDRAALPKPESWQDQRSGLFVPPRTPVERRIAAIWAELLGLDQVGVHDDFFALGGHSLMAMRVISRLQGDAGIEIPLQSLFDAPTVAGLAERIELLAWARSEGADAGDREEIDF